MIRSTSASENPAFDPHGVLRWATDLTGAGLPVYDPAKMTIADSGVVLGQLLYDSLLPAVASPGALTMGLLAPSLALRTP